MNNNIGKRIKELIDYLHLTYNVFSLECGITNYLTIKNIVTGKTKFPSMETLEKIIRRYPVRREWLIADSGKMWEKDYFEERFKLMHKKYKTPSQKITGLAEIFEINVTNFAQVTGINPGTLLKIQDGTTTSITEKNQTKIMNKFPYIPKKFFE